MQIEKQMQKQSSQNNDNKQKHQIRLDQVFDIQRSLKLNLRQSIFKQDISDANKQFKYSLKKLEDVAQNYEFKNCSQFLLNKLYELCHNMNKIEQAIILSDMDLLENYIQQFEENPSNLVQSCIILDNIPQEQLIDDYQSIQYPKSHQKIASKLPYVNENYQIQYKNSYENFHNIQNAQSGIQVEHLKMDNYSEDDNKNDSGQEIRHFKQVNYQEDAKFQYQQNQQFQNESQVEEQKEQYQQQQSFKQQVFPAYEKPLLQGKQVRLISEETECDFQQLPEDQLLKGHQDEEPQQIIKQQINKKGKLNNNQNSVNLEYQANQHLFSEYQDTQLTQNNLKSQQLTQSQQQQNFVAQLANQIFSSQNYNPYQINNILQSQNQQTDKLEVFLMKIEENNQDSQINKENLQKCKAIISLYKLMMDQKHKIKFDNVFDIFDKIQLLIEQVKNNQPSSEVNQLLESFINEKKHELKIIENEKESMQNCTKWLNETEGWQIDKENKRTQVYYRYIKGQPYVVIKASRIMKVNLKNLVSIIYEVDHYKNWFPFCNKTKDLGTPTIFQKMTYLKVSPPIISDREVYCTGWGVDRLQVDGSLLICVRSIDKDEIFLKEHNLNIPEETKKVIRSILRVATFQVVPVNKDEIKFTMVLDFDGKFSVPNSIVNFIVKKFAVLFMERIEKLSKEKNYKNSIWEKSVKQNPQFYDWVEESFVKPLNECVNKENNI
ncbi:hypothetical protein PPERSA_09882 [Pseudocohnilembus persalinus]|uniref:START domain-containing protein n=1 Tax=Pseudocohnilembus persalinus TaxID=266149 RepID=A0A0V0QTZ8_PSEPJ|nr:hypothetical protein PPERSA_09882 [Pseudocohnilembus persalinus]|eukprot:KRX05742.1 hypothetical protein PPERSA_09882 [Pseudocohnilembus persalinus]